MNAAATNIGDTFDEKVETLSRKYLVSPILVEKSRITKGKAMFQIEHIDHVALTVQNMERSIAWYQAVLGMRRYFQDVWNGQKDPVVLCTGTACVALFLADAGEVIRPTEGMRHFALRLDRANFEQAQTDLRQQGVKFTFSDHKICHSVYFLDPDGYKIELTTYDL